MKRLLFLLLALVAFQTASFSQSYITAFGVRVDKGLGLTLQQSIGKRTTLEVIGQVPFRQPELGLTALYEKHHKILLRNLNIYYGAGGHYYWKSDASGESDDTTNNVFGLSFIGGAELSLGRLNISADFKPELHLAGDQVRPFEWTGASVSVRYIIEKKQRKFLNFKDKKKKKSRGRFF